MIEIVLTAGKEGKVVHQTISQWMKSWEWNTKSILALLNIAVIVQANVQMQLELKTTLFSKQSMNSTGGGNKAALFKGVVVSVWIISTPHSVH